MRKRLFIKFISFVIFLFYFLVNISAQNCSFTASSQVENVTCPGNGKITVILADTSGKNLTNFRYSLSSVSVNVNQSTSNVFGGLSAGTYKVIVEAICGTSPASKVLPNIVVKSEYTQPSTGLVQGAFTSSHPYGTVPSFACGSTGQVQLRIEGGTFPYTVEISRNGSYLRTDTFPTNQNHGTNPSRYDYKDYYTIGNLSSGNYVFHITDGCGYTMPFVYANVPSLAQTYPQNRMYIYRDPARISDNVMRFSLLQGISGDNSFYYYGFSQAAGSTWWEYCLSVDGGSTFSSWKDISSNGVVEETLPISNYCSLYGKSVLVKVRDKICQKEYSKSFTIKLPNINSSYQLTTDSSVVTPPAYDACGYVSQKSVLYQHTSTYYQQFNSYKANQVSNTAAEFYYTPPLTVKVVNTTTGEVLHETTQTTLSYNWRENVNITPAMNGNTINIKVTDKNGCLISDNSQRINYQVKTTINGGGRVNTAWQINAAYNSWDHCGETQRGITIQRTNPSPDYLDSTVIKLIQSPDNNRYNFTALYLQNHDSWTIKKDNPTNTASIYGSAPMANNLAIAAVDLPTGTYLFQIITQCDTQTISKDFQFPEFLSVSKLPVYEFKNDCGLLNIVPVAGQVQVHGVNTPTHFKVVNGVPGGYSTDGVAIGGAIQLTIQGNYTIRMYSDIDVNSTCGTYDTVISYGGSNLGFDYLFAYVCDPADVTANLNVRGQSGKKPYTYTVYKDAAATIVLNSDTIGDYNSIPVQLNDDVYVRIEDACGASFIASITVVSLESTRKAWFDNNNEKELSVCEGSDVYLDGLSLGDVTYHWQGPDGFSDTVQQSIRHIGRLPSASGWYYMEVQNAYCPTVRDSIHLTILPSPYVNIAENAAICPGEEFPVVITAHGSDAITYTIIQEMNSVKTERTFTNQIDGQQDTIEVSPLSTLKLWLKEIADGQCSYHVPEDTISITIKSISSACNITSPLQEVCYDSTAILTAETVLDYPYIINWYQDENLTYKIQSDTITNASERSTYRVEHLKKDTVFYITASNGDFCEYKQGVTVGSINMSNGATRINCGESVRFYDSGAATGNYGNNESLIHTFVSANGAPVNIVFDVFRTEDVNFDKMYIYDGGNIYAPILASELGGDLNANLPGPYTSTGDSLTILFVSNFNNNFEGWSAIVGVQNGPVRAMAKSLDTLTLSVTSSQALPIHYNSSTTLVTHPQGGHGSYHYEWFTSNDSVSWNSTGITTASFQVNNLMAPTYYRCEVSDNSPDACGGKAESVVYLNVANIRLSLNLTTPDTVVCPEAEFPVMVEVTNSGMETARTVNSHVLLPYGVSVHGVRNFAIQFDSIRPGETKTLQIDDLTADASIRVQEYHLKAQIWSCDQGDADLNTVYGDWNWKGSPRQQDEAMLPVLIKRVVTNKDIIAPFDTVCSGSDIALKASSTISYPQFHYWYSDSLGTNLLQADTLLTNAMPNSEFTLLNLVKDTIIYFTCSNEQICPYTILQKDIEKYLYMRDGLDSINIDEIIRFYDSGGAQNYEPNENYTYTIISQSGDPIHIEFNSFITGLESLDYLYLYDGNTTLSPLLSPPLTGNLNSAMPLSFTTTGNALTLSFQSNDTTESYMGWEANITTVQQFKPVKAFVKQNPEVNITSPSSICQYEKTLLAPTAGGIWESSDTTVAVVANNGIVTSGNSGRVVFTFADAITGCSSTTDTLTVNPVPTIVIQNGIAICRGEDADLRDVLISVSGGSKAIFYSDAGNTVIAAPELISGLTSAKTFYVRAQDTVTYCESDLKSFAVTVNELPVITINSSIDACEGATVSLYDVLVSATGDAVLFYSDPLGQDTVPDPYSVTVTDTLTAFWVKTVNTTTQCESGVSQFNVRLIPAPVLTLVSNNSPICQGEDLEIKYAVENATGATVTGLQSGLLANYTSDTLTIFGIPMNPGVWNFTVSSTGQTSPCKAITTQGSYEVRLKPKAAFTYQVDTINTLKILYTSHSIISLGSIISVEWKFGDDSTSNLETVEHEYSTSGPYYPTLIVTSNNGCIDSVTQKVETWSVISVDFSIDDDQQCITGNRFAFTDHSTIRGAIADTVYHWDFGDGVGTSSQRDTVYTYAQPGIYVVTLSVSTGDTSQVGSKLVYVTYPPPVILRDTTICSGETVTLDNLVESVGGAIKEFYIMLPDSTFEQLHNYPYIVADIEKDTTFYIRMVYDINGIYCASEMEELHIQVNPVPYVVVFPGELSVCLNSPIADITSMIDSSSTGSALQFYTDPLGTSLVPNPEVVTITGPTPFWVRSVYESTGCTSDFVMFFALPYAVPEIELRNINVCKGSRLDLRDAVTAYWGNDVEFFLDANAALPVSYVIDNFTETAAYYARAIDTIRGCYGDLQSFIVTANPVPEVSNVHNFVYCHGEEVLDYVFSGTEQNTTYYWERVWGDDLGIQDSSGIDIFPSFKALNNAARPLIAGYRVIPVKTISNTACQGEEQHFLVTVNPMPMLPVTIGEMLYCEGESVPGYHFDGSLTDADYIWKRVGGDSIPGLPGEGANALPSFSAINTSRDALVAQYKITADYNFANRACNNGDTTIFRVAVFPKIKIDSIRNSDQVVCSGTAMEDVEFFTSSLGTTVRWTRVEGNIPQLPERGEDRMESVILVNNSDTLQTVVYQAIPVLLKPNGDSCTGAPVSFTITLLPEIFLNPPAVFEICSGETLSYIFGNARNVNYFYEYLTGDTVGLAFNGTGNTLSGVAINHGSTVLTAQYKVSAQYSSSNYTCSKEKIFYVKVNPNPSTIVSLNSYAYCSEEQIPTIRIKEQFASLDNPVTTKYHWKQKDTVRIGLPATEGVDTVPAFTTMNHTSSSLMATYGIVADNKGCRSEEKRVSITVNPALRIDTISDFYYCDGMPALQYPLSGNLPQATYLWERDTTTDSIPGLANSGYGYIPSFTAKNEGSVPLRSQYMAAMEYTSGGKTCSDTTSFDIYIFPRAVVDPVADMIICNGSSLHVEFSGAADIFRWEYIEGDTIGIGFEGEGNISVAAVTLDNSRSYTAVYRVLPMYGQGSSACAGISREFSISVMPQAVLNTPLSGDTICSGGQFDYRASSETPGVVYKWLRLPHAAINDSLGSEGTGNHIREILVNSSGIPVVVTYEISLELSGCISSAPQQVHVLVSPYPALDITALTNVCTNDSAARIHFTKDSDLQLEYKLTFSQKALEAGFVNMTDYLFLQDSVLAVLLPQNLLSNSYAGTMDVRSGNCSVSYPFVIKASLPVEIITQPASQKGLCDSVSEIMLQVDARGDNLSYQWYHNGNAIQNAISYTYRMPFADSLAGTYHVVVSGSCNSIESSVAEITTNTYMIEEKWDDVLFVDNASHQFVAYQWYRNGYAIATDGDAQYYTSKYGLNGYYHVRMHLEDGSYEETCPEYFTTVKSVQSKLYPNPVGVGETFILEIDMDKAEIARIELYTIQGELLAHQLASGSVVRLNSPMVLGVYIIRAYTDSEGVIVKRLIVK